MNIFSHNIADRITNTILATLLISFVTVVAVMIHNHNQDTKEHSNGPQTNQRDR